MTTNIDGDVDDDDKGNVRERSHSRELTDREVLVQETMMMMKSTKESLQYLRDHGYSISERTLRRDRESVKEKQRIRLFQIAKIDLHQQHMEKISKLEFMEKEMWKNYEQIQDPYKKNLAIERIANLIPIMSAYIDSSNYIIEKMFPSTFKDYYNNNIRSE